MLRTSHFNLNSWLVILPITNLFDFLIEEFKSLRISKNCFCSILCSKSCGTNWKCSPSLHLPLIGNRYLRHSSSSVNWTHILDFNTCCNYFDRAKQNITRPHYGYDLVITSPSQVVLNWTSREYLFWFLICIGSEDNFYFVTRTTANIVSDRITMFQLLIYKSSLIFDFCHVLLIFRYDRKIYYRARKHELSPQVNPNDSWEISSWCHDKNSVIRESWNERILLLVVLINFVPLSLEQAHVYTYIYIC